MKIKKPILIKEQLDTKVKEDQIIDELNESVPLNINTDNPIEADKEIELANNTKPADRNSIGNIINDINAHDLDAEDKEKDINKIKEELTTEQKKRVLNLLSNKHNIKLYLSTESEDILNNEINKLKEDFNADIFNNIVQDLESTKNLFGEIINLVNSREDKVNELLRRLDNPKLPDDIFKEYDLKPYMDYIGTIRHFVPDAKLERLIGCLLFILKESKIDLTKEDNEIFNMLNNSNPEDKSKIENMINKRIKEDTYTEELNKRVPNDKYTLYGTILNKNVFEVYLDSYFPTSVQLDSNMNSFILNSELNDFSNILNEIKNVYSNFKDEVIEDMKILEKKYESIIPLIKGSILNLNSPDNENLNTTWKNLKLIRIYYVSVMAKRLGDRMLAHYILNKLMLEILK